MVERSENHLYLVESPDHEMHGLALDRNTNNGIIIGGFAQIELTSIEPDCWLVRVFPMTKSEGPVEEQILKWYTPYNFKGTDYYISADLDMHPSHRYPRARVKVEAPRNIRVIRDELLNVPR